MRGGRQIGGPLAEAVDEPDRRAEPALVRRRPDPRPDEQLQALLALASSTRVTIESTAGFELALELTVKATLAGRRVAEVPTTWRDRTAGQSNFKLRKWLPHYLHWYWTAFRGRFAGGRRDGHGSSASPAGIADLRAASGGSGRLAAAARVAMLALIGLGWLWIGLVIATNLSNPAFGLDYRWHVEAAQRLLDTGTPYLPFELAGPFVIGEGAILYPPTAFLLFIPFIWLPAVLWWAIPIAVTAYGLWWHRPPLWAWVVITALFAFEKSINVYVFGNPSMWIVAAIAAGTDLALAVRLRPRQADVRADRAARDPPSELVDRAGRARGRCRCCSCAVWFDWFTVVRNSDVSLLYNLPTLPLMLAPLVAWATGRDRPHGCSGACRGQIAAERWPERADRRSDEAGAARVQRGRWPWSAPRGGLLVAVIVVAFTLIRARATSGSTTRSIGISALGWLAGWLPTICPHQLSGVPYGIAPMADVLYPPTALFLFVPLDFVPAIVWWVGAGRVSSPTTVWRWRPAPWAWARDDPSPDVAEGEAAFLFGNSDMWMAAGDRRRPAWGWPALHPGPQAELPAARRSWVRTGGRGGRDR